MTKAKIFSPDNPQIRRNLNKFPSTLDMGPTIDRISDTEPRRKTRNETRKTENATCNNCKKLEKVIAQLLSDQKSVPPKQRYFSEDWVAARIGATKKALQAWRLKGEELPYYKFSGMIRYRFRDLIAYEKASRRRNSSEQ